MSSGRSFHVVIFLFPLVYSVYGAFMTFLSDVSWPTKIIVALLTIVAAAMQFVPAIASMVHFLVPLALQIVVIGTHHVIQANE